MPITLQQLIEETNVRHPVVRCVIGGAVLPKVSSVEYNFQIGEVPTCIITVPNRAYLPGAVVEEASVQVWFGFRSGVTILEQLVYGGAVVDSVSFNGPEVVIECVMDGPRKLAYSYNRRIEYEFNTVTAEEAVEAMMGFAGVSNYFIDLPAWLIGTAAVQTIQFSTYGEAINKIAEVDGSPWYALPTGQVRVEVRDPLPSPSARRTYFSGILTGPVESQPLGITNPSAKSRILDISKRKYRSEVANFIEVDGAVIVTLGPSGEQNSNQIVEFVDGASGQFPNGAYWIPTPPLFQDFTFSNELIDTNVKAFEVAERYFDLKNRLIEKIPLTIPGDPDVFLGSTVKIVDPRYSGVQSLYFVKGYRTTIDEGSCITELDLVGGPESGTTGYASPFAEFMWKYQALHELIPGGYINQSQNDLGPNTDPGAKLCEDLPADTGDEEHGGDYVPGEDRRTVLIGLDGTPSQDFDGQVVSWVWTYDIGTGVRTMIGPRQTVMFDPDDVSSVEMTLTVTDDTGRTSAITKTIYTSADYIDPGSGDPANDPTENDTDNGGGNINGPCCDPDTDACGDPDLPPGGNPGGGGDPPSGIPDQPSPGRCNGMGTGYFIAAGAYAMGTLNNRDWNDLTPAAAGATGEFTTVIAGVIFGNQKTVGVFGTTAGEIVFTNDICLTGEVVYVVPGGSAITALIFDNISMGSPASGDELDSEGGIGGDIPVYTQGSPGTMTIMEAYQQCLAVGFTPSMAVMATAIMIAESGLVSDATNTAGNNPPSTDRGIAQINSYYHPQVTAAQAFNTEFAIGYMFTLSGGSDFTPWAAYNAGTYKQYLAQVQDTVGVIVDPDAPTNDNENTSIRKNLKAWLGTEDGRLFFSMDSGKTWTLYSKAAHAITTILTPRLDPALWVFGGSTSDIRSLILVDAGNGQLRSVDIRGALREAILSAGGSEYISCAVFNSQGLAIGFSGGVEPPVWMSTNPLEDSESWVPAVGITDPGVLAIAKGFDADLLVG